MNDELCVGSHAPKNTANPPAEAAESSHLVILLARDAAELELDFPVALDAAELPYN